MHPDYCNIDSAFHRGLLAGRRVIRKCGLTKEEARGVKWDRSVSDHFESGWTDEEKCDFSAGFDDGVEEGIDDLD